MHDIDFSISPHISQVTRNDASASYLNTQDVKLDEMSRFGLAQPFGPGKWLPSFPLFLQRVASSYSG